MATNNNSNSDDGGAADGQQEEIDYEFPDDVAGGEGALGYEFDDPDAGEDDGVEAKESLPDDLAGDADGGPEVDMSAVNDAGVDVDSIKTPRPVTRTIAARFLEFDGHPNQVNYDFLPDRSDDECGCSSDDEDGDDEGECTCERNDDGIPYQGATPRRRRVADAVDRLDAPQDNDDDDDVERASVYGRVVRRFEVEGEFEDELSVRLADETGVVDVDLHPKMSPLQDFSAGDEVLVTHVQRTGEDTDPAFTVTSDSACLRVADGDEDALSQRLKEQTALVHTPDKFDSAENMTAANNWVADIIVREWTVETPRGTDEMYVYIDDADSEQYGTFAGEGESRIKETVDQYLPPARCNARNKNEIVKLVKDRTYVKKDAFRGGAPDAEARRWSVAVENGVIDLRTGELYEHDPAWRCTSKLPVEYDPAKGELGDAWDRFLDDVTKEPADRETLLYMVAHALARHYPIEAIFALIGPGKNGKTVFNKAVSPLFGDVMGTTDIGMMTDPGYEFGAGSVKGLHLAVDDDATDIKAQDLSLLKKLSGGAETQMHEKEEKVNGADYDNYATLVMLSNDPPVFGDKSDGAKRRMYPVIMPHKFTSDPSDDHKDAVSEDELLADLTSEEELQRLLAVAVQYAQEIHRDCEDELPVGRSESERWELYEQYSDSVMQFWSELMTQETGARVPRSVVYEIYVQWAETNGIDALPAGGRNGFWQLSDQCPAVSYKRDGVYTDGDRAVEHVMLTSKAMEHAPQWVRDEWKDDVSEDKSTLANRLDRVTPIADLNKGYCTTKGTVIDREHIDIGDARAVKLTIEDNTHAIDVAEWDNQPDDGEWDAKLDGVDVGDEIRLERAKLTADKGVPELKVSSVTETTVAEAGPLKEIDDTHTEDGDDGESDDEDEELPQAERVKTVENAIAAHLNDTAAKGAYIDDVLDDVDRRGIDRERARQDIERLKHRGEVYTPAEDHLVLTHADEGE